MGHQIIAIAIKDLKIFFKDIGAVVLIFLMPLMFIVLMSYALAEPFGSVKDKVIPLPVVLEDEGAAARELVKALDGHPAFDVEQNTGEQPLNRQLLEQLIRSGDRAFGVIVPQGFSDGPENAGDSGKRVELMADPSTTMQVIEPVRGTLGGLLQGVLVKVSLPGEIDSLINSLDPTGLMVDRELVMKRVQQSMDELLAADEGGRAGLRRVAPAGMHAARTPDPFQQNVPGYTLFGIFWIVVLLAESVMQERKDGTFRRLLVSPMSPSTMLAGKLLPYFMINLIQVALMLLVARLLFGMDLGESPAGLLLVSLSACAAATGLGVLVSSLARTEAQTRGLTILVLLTLSALGGCFVPRFIMPDAMQTVGLITPHAWALDAYQDLLVRGLTLSDVLPEVGALLGFAAVFFIVGVWRFRFS